MKISKRMTLLLCILLVAIVAAGCTAARKPEVNNTKDKVTQENRQAETLAREATQVEGVKKAYVVVSGNMAVVGLDTDKDTKKAEITRIKGEVGQRLRNADGQINDVRVATDANTVTRIRNISEGITNGKPVSSFGAELNEIVRRITPTKE
ncbi:YhcN/YlaJ family sporulation lipoprotein [Desulforamulus reducens]|uniref:YhcN/YlaJ family sporulation lipoprotein n=1 Tax=Desulforamulus reducens TaxID=59610 RepID=UPI000310454B|nr:YhcN/YlaJ family sporulation lipoprotein [Desulforamulus reducens]